MSFVSDQLALVQDRQIDWKGDRAFIQCPNPAHAGGRERTPSCSVQLATDHKWREGSFFCFGCGFKGRWNDLAELLHLRKTDDKSFHKDPIFPPDPDSKYLPQEEDVDDVPKHVFRLPWDSKTDWRDIPGQLLFDVGGELEMDPETTRKQLILPVIMFNKKVGEVACRLVPLKKGVKGSNYYNSKTIKEEALFPYDYVANTFDLRKWPVVLVEGVRDALHLIKFGVPALAILGTQKWNEEKLNAVLELEPRKVILLFDGDDAGWIASKKVFKSMEGKLPVNVIRLPSNPDGSKKIDPAMFTKKQALSLLTR